jgi:hypothetical protein
MIVTIRHKLVAGIISLIAAAVLFPLLAGFADTCFTQYRNEQYNYSITLPASWTIMI